MRYSHLRTPRTRRDAFGPDDRLNVDKIDTAWHWAMALAIGAMIGLLIGLGA